MPLVPVLQPYPPVNIHMEVRAILDIDIEQHTFEAIIAIHMNWTEPGALSPSSSSSSSQQQQKPCLEVHDTMSIGSIITEEESAAIFTATTTRFAESSGTLPPPPSSTTPDWAAWEPELSANNAFEWTVLENRAFGSHDPSPLAKHFHCRDLLVKGKFHTMYNARYFPFDSQELAFIWRCKAGPHHQHFPVAEFRATRHRNVRLTQWHLSPNTMAVQANESRTRFGVTCHVRRRYWYYVWKVVFVLFCIGTYGLTNYLQSTDAFKDRTDHNLNIYLPVIMLQYTILNLQVSYLTVLDHYFNAVMFFLLLIELSNVLVHQRDWFDDDEELIQRWNNAMLWTMSGIWFGWHIILSVYLLYWERLGLKGPYKLVTGSGFEEYSTLVTTEFLHELPPSPSTSCGDASDQSSSGSGDYAVAIEEGFSTAPSRNLAT